MDRVPCPCGELTSLLSPVNHPQPRDDPAQKQFGLKAAINVLGLADHPLQVLQCCGVGEELQEGWCHQEQTFGEILSHLLSSGTQGLLQLV